MNRLLFIFLLFLLNCQRTHKEKAESVRNSNATHTHSNLTLLENVKLAISPKFEDWVLFENGTYIIFEKADTLADIKAEAIKLMKEYGPVYAGGPAGDFSVTHLNRTEGWVVSGHCYGMYTYVNPTEMEGNTSNDAEVGVFGRSKRDKDGKNPVIVHVNRKQ